MVVGPEFSLGKRIAIFGAYKSGTTGLFYKIRNSYPGRPRTLFEAKQYDQSAGDLIDGVLAKVILGADADVDLESFIEFDRKVLLVRDPRDWIVSAALFLTQELEPIYRSEKHLRQVLDLLMAKEKDPDSISFRCILDEILTLGGKGPFDLASHLKRHFAHFFALIEHLKDGYVQKYEDMIDGNWNGLEFYLGFPLNGTAKVDDIHSHVPRTMAYGGWKNWFLATDVDYFRELFLPYMLRFGYTDDWRLPEQRSIRPEICTEYVKRVVDHRRKIQPPPAFSYRLCREEDGQEINRGFNEIFGQKRTYEEWRWKFLQDQAVFKGVVGVDSAGAIVSHFSVIPMRVQVDGRPFLAGQPVDSFCLRRPGTLRHRVFVNTVRKFYEHYRKVEHFGLFIGFPGKRHLRLGQLKLDYGASKPFTIWRRSRLIRPGWIGRLASAFVRQPDVVRGEPGKAWCENLWQNVCSRYPVAVVRDYEWTRCRYFSRPGQLYFFLGIQRGGEPAAWSVFRAASGALQWVDVIWDGRSEADLAALDREADRLADEAGLASIELWLSGDAAVESYLRQNGWTEGKHAEELGLSTLLIDDALSGKGVLERYYLTLGDTDLA